MQRALRWILGVLAAAVLGYLVAANVLLMTSLGRKLASSPHTQVDWGRGYSILPMRVHLRDVTVRVERKHGTWQIASGRFDATLSPVALLRGRFYARGATAEEVSVIGQDATAAMVAPPVEAPAPAPIALVRPVDPAYSEPAREPEAPAVQFDDLLVDHVRVVRVGAIAYRGDAAIRGSVRFYDTPAAARVDNATVDARSGDLDIGGAPVLRGVRGHLTMTRHEVDVDAPPARAWLGAIDGGVELDAAVMTNAVAALGLKVPAAEGTLRTSLRISGGALAPGSTAALHVPSLGGSGAPTTFAADFALGVGADGHATVGGLLHEVAWAPSENGAIAVAPTVRLNGESPRVRVASPLEGSVATLDIENGHVDPSRVPVLRDLVSAAPNAVRGSAHLVITGGAARGTLTMRADLVELTLGDRATPGALDVSADLQGWRVGSSEAHLDVRASHSAPNGHGGAARASIELEDVVFRFGDVRSVDGAVAIAMSSALPALDAVTGRATLPAVIAAVASTQPLEASAFVHADADGVRLRDIRATAGLLGARGVYARQRTHRAATLLLEAGPLAVGVSVNGPETSLILADPRRWFDEALAAGRPASGAPARKDTPW